MSAELVAGWARNDITPPIGIHMGGYWGRTSGARGVLDPLEAKALVLGDGPARIALLVLDIVALGAAHVRIIRDRIGAVTGIHADAVMVCCTHTHAGPLTLAFRGMGEIDGDYMARLQDAAVDAVVTAAADLVPATVRYGRAPVQIGLNRRTSQGPVADYAHVLEIATSQRQAVVFSHACHPVVMGPQNHGLSAGFPGAAARRIEAGGVSSAMFVNGACADINPRITQGSRAQVAELGDELAAAVTAAIEAGGVQLAPSLLARRTTVFLPLLDPPGRASLAAELLVSRLRAFVKKRSVGGDYWGQLISQARLQWARDTRARIRAGSDLTATPFEIQALRVGELVLLGMEGEMFVRYQLDLERVSARQPMMLCGYANGCIGYVPTADEFERGGYEVGRDHRLRMSPEVEAYMVYPSTQRISPGCEGIIRDTVSDMLGAPTAG